MAAKLTKTQTQQWEQAGHDAFDAGVIAVPTADPAVLAAITGLPVGAGAAPIMRAWTKGWHAANLAAPVA